MREGTKAGGVGEEEAGSQQRSLTWGSIPECWAHALSRRQTLNDCTTQAPHHKRFLTIGNTLRIAGGQVDGGWGNKVKGMKEGT